MPDATNNLGKLLAQITTKNPDIVEFRMDKLEDTDSVAAIGGKKTFPAIAAHRGIKDSTLRNALLLAAAKSGFEYVDIDLALPDARKLAERCKASGAKIIASTHNFQDTPPLGQLGTMIDPMRELDADICKIVTTATHPRDNLVVLNFLEEKSQEAKLVSFAMGSLGIPSRILSPVYGAEFTFAALNSESKTAEGQLSIDDLRSAWQLLGIQ
jgi:3-dehydroquinate dehydratase type I